MREIKFRAWDVKNNKMFNPDYIDKYGMAHISGGVGFHKISEIVMQYAGLKDAKGKEIYEGDIVRVANNNVYLIEYSVNKEYDYEARAAMFILRGKIGNREVGFPFDEFSIPNCVVIGNIYENPELLK